LSWLLLTAVAILVSRVLAALGELAANVEPYTRADGTKVWNLMLLERELRPGAYRHQRGGYLDRRRTATAAQPGGELNRRATLPLGMSMACRAVRL
jgi:hypothetical protein